ncbi:MAG: trigger factor [Eubacteriaceae bacterium]|jgi:trigger factor|nr:trigger factor [Eubacteriaceae bacterium]
MKSKKIAVLLSLCLSVCFLFTGCGTPYSGYNLTDYITPGKYKGLEVKAYTIKITDKQVSSEINDRLKAAATTKKVTAGTVKKGDKINIDYVGTIKGKTFDGGSAEDQTITLGSSNYIDGFDKGLYGTKIGSTVKLHLTFPDDYSTASLAGKDVVFKVTVNYKEKAVVPELDKTFVKNNSDETTVSGYKAYIRKELKKEKTKTAIQAQKDYLWSVVLSNFKLKKDSKGEYKYPEKEVDRIVEYMTEKYQSYADQYGKSFDQFLKDKMGMNEKKFKKIVKDTARTEVKKEMVLYYIADKQNIKVSKKEYKQYIQDALDKLGYTEAQFKSSYGATYEDYNGEDNIWYACYLAKVEDYLLDNAKVVSRLPD